MVKGAPPFTEMGKGTFMEHQEGPERKVIKPYLMLTLYQAWHWAPYHNNNISIPNNSKHLSGSCYVRGTSKGSTYTNSFDTSP